MIDPRRSSRKGKGQHRLVDVPVNLTGNLTGRSAQNIKVTDTVAGNKRSLRAINKDQENGNEKLTPLEAKRRKRQLAKLSKENGSTKKTRVTKSARRTSTSEIGLADIETLEAKAAAAEATLKLADQAIKELSKQVQVLKNQLQK
eukprot:TRINITY_DN597_c1_g1_i5.p3 TRINITY_DN597_c1_g1~~TRINITY_DN597_c1_g1_i5.p3  ORF type:complete len:145 (-),score=16.30 TRINITY_DN597_c1_g1_i5:456-890(-)